MTTATIKRGITICERAGYTVSRQERAKVAAENIRNAKRDAQMAQKKASVGQMNRINALHDEQGLRQYASLRAFRACFPTMLSASLYWGEIS